MAFYFRHVQCIFRSTVSVDTAVGTPVLNYYQIFLVFRLINANSNHKNITESSIFVCIGFAVSNESGIMFISFMGRVSVKGAKAITHSLVSSSCDDLLIDKPEYQHHLFDF